MGTQGVEWGPRGWNGALDFRMFTSEWEWSEGSEMCVRVCVHVCVSE